MSEVNVTFQECLHYQNAAENSDKLYVVQLVSIPAIASAAALPALAAPCHGIRFAYGRRGRSLKAGWKTCYTPYYAARDMFDAICAEKRGKGYLPLPGRPFSIPYPLPVWPSPPASTVIVPPSTGTGYVETKVRGMSQSKIDKACKWATALDAEVEGISARLLVLGMEGAEKGEEALRLMARLRELEA